MLAMETTLTKWLDAKRGRAAALAVQLGIREVNLARWRAVGIVPAQRCADVERITGIPCESLNPRIEWRRVRERGWPGGRPVIVAIKERT